MEIRNIYGKTLYSDDSCSTKLQLVKKAVKEKISLYEADLRGANLRNANLRNIDLRRADLRNTNLEFANLEYTNLRNADLRNANLIGANLWNADLRNANLISANLRNADLRGANFEFAHLQFANLIDADLIGAKNVPYIPLACPSEGSFIGWKKVENCIIKLKILENSKRSSATTNKCRCDKAKVLSITEINTEKELAEITNTNYKPLTYKVGEVAIADKFDEDRWNECSNGIHFFINKQEAINY